MPKLKLTYFDMHGGRAEAARLALILGGVPFEDDRFVFSDWPALKPKMPYGAVPVLEVDGRQLAQSNAITRYVGKLAGLYPSDPWQAAICDEVMDSIEDMAQQFGPTFRMPAGDEKKAAREALAQGPLTRFLRTIGGHLADGAEYFVGDSLSIADLRVFVWVRFILSGKLDYVSSDLPKEVAPNLAAHCDRVAKLPAVLAYYASFEK